MLHSIVTGAWSTPLPDGYLRIGISRGTPRSIAAGYRLFKRLAPGVWFNDPITPLEYHRRYRAEVLDKLNPLEVAAQIRGLAGGSTAVLCCYETKAGNEWCHRAMAARWLSDALGAPVPEYGFETMPQASHPFLPREMRAIAV